MCDQFGDPEYGGGIWFLNPANYARNMYKMRAQGEGFKGAEAGLETGEAFSRNPYAGQLAMIESGEPPPRQSGEYVLSGQGSQVVPLEHADRVLELCSPIGLMACLCRKSGRAIDERSVHEYTCMGMGVGMLKWERWPERYKGGVTFVNIDEAKEWNHEMDRRGFVHILMLFGAPFIGGFCQCDYPDCMIVRMANDFGTGGAMKSHHVAAVDYDKCNGCGICVQRCQWGALKFEVTTGKANIDLFKCYGCGLCETGCPRKAIKLLWRSEVPAVAEVW